MKHQFITAARSLKNRQRARLPRRENKKRGGSMAVLSSIPVYFRLLPSLFALCVLTAAAPAPAGAKEDRAFDEAVEHYQRGRWNDAYGRFIELANNGDRDGARIALFMLRYGPRLYASQWDASPDEVEEWEALAGQRSKTVRAAPVFTPAYRR